MKCILLILGLFFSCALLSQSSDSSFVDCPKPVANAGPDDYFSAPEKVKLNGMFSYDPNESPLKFQWAQLRGPQVVIKGDDTPMPKVHCKDVNLYEFVLIVTNLCGMTDRDTVLIYAY